MVTALRNMALFGCISLSVQGSAATESNWPSFRGPQASGLAEGFKTPAQWDIEKGQNLKWKTAIPGLGHSSPIIWGNQLFVTTAVKETAEAELKVGLYGDINPVNEAIKHSWILLCLNKANGRVLWQQTAHEGMPTFKRHPKSSHANSTPATEGQHVVCFFGSEGLFCFDMRGKQLWQKNLGPLDAGYYLVRSAQWGFGSSPIIHNGQVIVQCDVQTNSFLAAFDVKDGRELWRTSRHDVPTWSTPTLLIHQGRAQVVVNGFKHVGGYEVVTGREIWRLTGGGDIPVPTPVVANGLIFITSAHGRMAPIYAIQARATGDVTLGQNETRNDHIVWSQSRRGNYMQTPLVAGEHLYCCNDAGVLACYLARTGENLYSERLGPGGSGFTASGVAADGQLYFGNENGLVYVVKAGPRFEIIATNSLGETCMATPAISEGKLFFRTRHHLVAVGPE